MKRSDFIKFIGTTSLLPYSNFGFSQNNKLEEETNSQLNLKIKSFINQPVIIENIQLLQWQKEMFVVVTDANNNKGISLCNTRMPNLISLFTKLIAPFFLKKDATKIEQLVEDVYADERNYKYSGMPFWNCVGHIEVAIWDLLGKVANKPVYELLGTSLRTQLPMYLSSLTRENTAHEEFAKLQKALNASNCKAVKIKVGGRLKTNEGSEKRSYELIELLRKNYGNSITIYADANGSYTATQAITMGKYLESNDVDILEEPCPWEDFETTQFIKSKLHKIKIAGGEQDTSFKKMEWYCKHKALNILQPDVFYNGGIIRALKVAQLAKQYQIYFAPHSPKANALQSPFLHTMLVAPAVYGFQEYPLNAVGKKTENWWQPNFTFNNGFITINSNIGLGVLYDDSIFLQATIIQ
jgi:L-alanine-DL-glutamate epimerase-like enolase superfamily enzyme